MNSLIEKYSRKYRRVSIASDAKSEHASDILFNGIKKYLEYEIPLTLKLSTTEPLSKFHVLDEYEYIGNFDGAPFRVVVNNWYPNIKRDDGFLFRGMHWNSMDGTFKGVPTRLVFESELVIQLIDNKLTVVKDRHGVENIKDMDIRPFLRNNKIKVLIKNING